MAPIPNDAKQGSPTMTKAAFQEELADFSLLMGGPIFQLFRKAHLTGDHLELLKRRLLTIVSIAWLPMLVLDLVASRPGIAGRLTFLHDVEVQARFLVALPVLIVAELIVHSRLRPVVQRFVERRIVRGEDLPRFEAAIESALRLRNSIPVELALLVSVYTLYATAVSEHHGRVLRDSWLEGWEKQAIVVPFEESSGGYRRLTCMIGNIF